MRPWLRELGVIAWGVGAHVVAIIAGFLPRRHWRTLETRLPISTMAVPSALLAFVLGFGIGGPGFLRYAERAAATSNEAMLELMYRQMEKRRKPGPGVETAGPVGISMLSLVAFSLFTPLGLLASYLVASGLVRLAMAWTDEPGGDLLLTAVDAGARHVRHKARDEVAAAQRRRVEGPEVPDVLVSGKEAGVPEADFVLVASRQKLGWVQGAFVVTSEKWYRIGAPYERKRPAGLRYFYPLCEVRDLEVLRKGVTYELPPLSESLP